MNNTAMDEAKLLLESHELIRSALNNTSAASNMDFNEKVKAMISSGRDIVHFGFGQSPFPVPNCMIEHLKANAHKNSYLPLTGIPELREALVCFHHKYDQLNLDKDNFICGPGSKELIYLFMNVFNGTILIPSPAWTTYKPQAHFSGKSPVIVETDKSLGWKVTASVIEKAIKSLDSEKRDGLKMLILTNPGNPTGTCYSEEEIIDLSSVCRRNKVIVLSDEIYSRLTFHKKVHCPMIKHYPEGTIMTSGFSKWASAGGWRLGYAYVPQQLQPLFDVVRNCVSHTFACAPAPMQFAVAKALVEDSEELDDYMKNCALILQWVSHYCYRELKSVGVTGHISEAGYYFLPDFEIIREGLAKKNIFTSNQMTEAILKEMDVALLGSETFLRPSSELSVRFCFVCFDGAEALKALKILRLESKEMKTFDEDFVRKNCQKIVQGIDKLKSFVESYKNV